MNLRKHIFISLIVLINTQESVGQTNGLLLPIHTDLPRIVRHDKLILDVYYESDSTFRGSLSVHYFKYNSDFDSIEVAYASNLNIHFKKGAKKVSLDFTKADTGIHYNNNFYEILKRTHSVAPGQYKAIIGIANGLNFTQRTFLYSVDTILQRTSPLRKKMSQSLYSKSSSISSAGSRISKSKSPTAAITLQNRGNRIERVAKKHGLTPVQYEKDNRKIIDLYYGDWFAGRYQLANNEPMSNELASLDKIGSPSAFSSLTANDLDHPSLFSQFKQLNSNTRDEEIKGEISLSTNLSTGQEEHSTVDNNYYELRGRTMLPVAGMPIGLEGLYTSQDVHRTVKSSYFRIHYDVESLKDNLAKSLQAYNTKYSETKSKGVGLEQVYGTGINNLQAQRDILQAQLRTSKGASGPDVNTLNPDDSLTGAEAGRLAKKRSEIAKTEKQIEALDQKINRYKLLLDQNRNTNYFDSTVGYSKTKDISSTSGLSYKEMSKMGASLLPDGQAKKFITGITTMDVGMFPKTSSKYTMNGQMMKGADFGYDFGVLESSTTVGKTQYVGRDGNMDQFTCYSLKAQVKASKHQKISALYYGYAPDKAFLSDDNFFKHANISAPSFFQPVHIMSLDYDGEISKYANITGEIASSLKQRDKTDVLADASTRDKMAYHFGIDGVAPIAVVPLAIQATYDNVGKAFENSTLPISMSGTEQYKIAAKTDFFKGSINLGVDYNRLEQKNLASTGSNTKWGFDFRFNSRRYPSLAVSYKPFTTVRTFNDTLNVPQHPMLGSVWTSKVSYQLKQHSKAIRLQLLYNHTSTVMDTSSYGSILLQSSAVYTERNVTGGLTIGYMEQQGANLAQTQPNKMNFLSLSSSYNLNKKVSVNAGQDFGLAAFGFCRYSATAGIMVRFAKKPFTIRLNTRYNTYQLQENEKWKQLYSGFIDMIYAFKTKVGGRH